VISAGTIEGAFRRPVRQTGRPWVLTVDVFEAGRVYPLVRHQFFGLTPRAARQVFRRHLRVDAFLRGHVERGDHRILAPVRLGGAA